MFKRIFIGLILGLSLVVGGCAKEDLVYRDPATLVTAEQKAQAAFSQAKIVWVSLSKSARADRKAGLYTDAQWNVIKSELQRIERSIRIGQKYATEGNAVLAGDYVKAVELAIASLKVELAKKVAKENN